MTSSVDERQRPHRITWQRSLLLVTVLVAAFLRLYQLDLLPPGLFYDEAYNGLDVRGILSGAQFPLYFSGNNGREPLFLYLQSLVVAGLGYTPYALRVTAALIGIASVGRFAQVGDEFPEQLSTDVYRVFQELLNNVAKHSGATQAGISLLVTPEEVELAVRDNGVGFDPKTISSDHLGLSIMNERAEEIGAILSIHAQPGQGTEVTITWCPGPLVGPPNAPQELASVAHI